MRRAPAVLLLLLVLVYGSLSPPELWSQDPESSLPAMPAKEFRLEQNQPNPVNPETWIPFYLEESLFKEGQTGVVSIRIYNILRQLVAVPVAVQHPRGKNIPVTSLRYTEPGRKVAYWDGKDLNGRRVASGIYYCELVVNEKNDFIRMMVVAPRRRGRIFPPFFRN